MNQYHLIRSTALPSLRDQIATLNNRAKRTGCPPISVSLLATTTRREPIRGTDLECNCEYSLICVLGESPRIAGWRLVAVANRLPSGASLLHCWAGEVVPSQYGETRNHCDHCQTRRDRTQVFILANDDGRYAQVGRQCLRDYLGHASVDSLLAAAKLASDLQDLLTAIGDDPREYGSSRGYRAWDIAEFTCVTAAVVRGWGFVPSGHASSTVGFVSDYLLGVPMGVDVKVLPEDMETAAAALAWARELPVGGGYEGNLGTACRESVVNHKTAGIVASLITAYQRHVERESQPTDPGNHVGVVGERTGFAGVKVASLRSIEGMYGVRTLVRMTDSEGNTLIWWKSGGCSWQQDQVLDITGTVTKHDDYRGVCQTVLSRVVEGLPKAKKRAKAVEYKVPIVNTLSLLSQYGFGRGKTLEEAQEKALKQAQEHWPDARLSESGWEVEIRETVYC